MSHENSHQLRHAISADNHVEKAKHPWKVHRLELRAEPKIDDCILVELAPNIHHRQNHGIHQDVEFEDESDDDAAQPVEKPHEGVISGATIKEACF